MATMEESGKLFSSNPPAGADMHSEAPSRATVYKKYRYRELAEMDAFEWKHLFHRKRYLERRYKLQKSGKYKEWWKEQFKKSAERFKRLPVEEQERRKRANGFAAKRWRKQKQMDGTWETYTRELNERRRQQRAAKMAAMSKEEHLAHNRERYRRRKANEEEKRWRWLEFNLLAHFPWCNRNGYIASWSSHPIPNKPNAVNYWPVKLDARFTQGFLNVKLSTTLSAFTRHLKTQPLFGEVLA